MYFQIEDTNFQLMASIKNNLKIAEDQTEQGIVLATTTCHTLSPGLVVTWKYIFQVRVMFVWAWHKSFYIDINMICVNKN